MLHIRLKELRTDNEMTQSELGNRVGVIKQTVSSWESNTSAPNYEIVCKLAKIFNVSTDYLFGVTDKATPPPDAKNYDADIKFALFGDIEIDDDVMAEVKDYAKFVAERKKREKNDKA